MQMFRGKCAQCAWLFDIVTMPMPVPSWAMAVERSCCPMCGNGDGNTTAPARSLTSEEIAHKAKLIAGDPAPFPAPGKEPVSSPRTPWAHIAHKNGQWCGLIAANHDDGTEPPPSAKMVKEWKREVAKFCGEHIAEGFEIKTVYSREEHKAFMATVTVYEAPGMTACDPDAGLPLFDAVAP